MEKQKVFINSVQKEFANERERLYLYLQTDALLSSFFEPVMFEKLPAKSQTPNKVYLSEVAQSQVYLLLLGIEYGYEDKNSISPTELEYEHAKKL
jgi:ATP-dependent DNA helicase RecG